MTPKETAITALTLGKPEGLVPTFELEFQLTEELLGKNHHRDWRNVSPKERDRMLHENAELYIEIAERLDYSIIMDVSSPGDQGHIDMVRIIRELVGDKYLLIVHGDATFSIPNGVNMEEAAYSYFERGDEM